MPTAESGPNYIWISRWGDFQHYAPERDRAPAWIKTYTKQHDEDDYRALTGPQRAVLHDLRIAFARARGKLTIGTRTTRERTTWDTRAISQRIGLRVTNETLETLNDAGYIEIVSRQTLEERLDQLYNRSSPRARGRTRGEGEVERELDQEQEPPSFQPELRNLNGSGDHQAPAADDDIPFDDEPETTTVGRKEGA